MRCIQIRLNKSFPLIYRRRFFDILDNILLLPIWILPGLNVKNDDRLFTCYFLPPLVDPSKVEVWKSKDGHVEKRDNRQLTFDY